MKRCSTCGELKELSEFYLRKNARSGRCRDCENRKAREWRAANPDKVKEQNRRHYAANREQELAAFRAHYLSLKAEVLEHYGTCCACCGSTEVLSIDHPDGDGHEHRKELFGDGRKGGGRFYAWLKRNGWPSGYQVLCRSCNSSKQRYGCCKIHNPQAPRRQPASLTARELRSRLAARIELAHFRREPTVITHNGQPRAVLISYEEWAAMKAPGDLSAV